MQAGNPANSQPNALIPMLIIGILFFIFGFVTWLNGALIPFLQIVCELTESQALLIAFSFYIAYVVMALPMAWVLDKTGYKKAMSLGLGLIAVGCLLFIPASYSREFSVFLIAQFLVGTGLTILQTASNPYIVKIGPQETAAVRISIMGLLNKFAGFIAPIVFTALVLGEFSQVNAQSIAALSEADKVIQIAALADGLVKPYAAMALVLFVLAILLNFSSLPDLVLEKPDTENDAPTKLTAYPQLILGVIALFLYVGVEVIAGDTIGLFGSQLGVENATTLTSYTMAFMVLGYLLGLVIIPSIVNQSQALSGSAILGIILSIAIVFSNSQSIQISAVLWGWMGLNLLPDTITLIAILGFANALVWPAIWPLALDGLFSLTARGSALLIMAISGGAILPMVYGILAEHFSSHSAYWMMLPCYGFILFYAVKGHKIKAWKQY
ncbi:sugar MFS transporter [Paraglaciecola aquimarina]|uniref:Sugar MFS transporter n=1 Tax=Paraglaciecola aquimarina TaxID=1235557 RepID=A0ABU3SY62_9ALTE|nr:sugar MFS transporter [Paraglaciecola aquimarina]MDU0354958.1 sugar MFS transporter [Paraglaciecola aquimarina]